MGGEDCLCPKLGGTRLLLCGELPVKPIMWGGTAVGVPAVMKVLERSEFCSSLLLQPVLYGCTPGPAVVVPVV